MKLENIETYLTECKQQGINPKFKGYQAYEYLCERGILSNNSKVILFESKDHDMGKEGEWYRVNGANNLEIMTTGEPPRLYNLLLREEHTPGGWMPLLGYDKNEPRFG